MKVNIFWGDLSDISAKKEALPVDEILYDRRFRFVNKT